MNLRKYGVATVIKLPLILPDDSDFLPADPGGWTAPDIMINKDDGGFALRSASPDPLWLGRGWIGVQLSATDMTAKTIEIDLKDQAGTKAWKDQGAVIETYGHASSMHPEIGNLDSNVVNVNGTSVSSVDDFKADLTTIESKLPDTGLIASQEDVLNLQNNTKLRISIAPTIQIPSSGDVALPIDVYFYDNQGVLTDPDDDEIAVQIRNVNIGDYKTDFYDNEIMNVASTGSTTFTPSFYKMNKISTGIYKIYYKLTPTVNAGFWTVSIRLKEQTLDIAGSVNVNIVEQMQTITLADSTANHQVIATSFFQIPVPANDSLNPASIYATIMDEIGLIVNKLPAGTISDFDLNKTVDGVTVGKVLELAMAMVDGRIRKNVPNEGDLTFYRRDNTTVLTITRTTDTERTRI